jgi:flagellar biosynthesis/type III secretory pathway protein FliH
MGRPTWKPLLAATFCLLVAAPLDAGQSGRGRGANAADRGRPNSTRNGYDEGYRDGLRQGEADARSGRAFNVGPADQSGYRLGFAEGYRIAYNRQFVNDPVSRDRQHVNEPLRQSREHVNAPLRIDRQHANEPFRGQADARSVQQPRGIGRGYREPAFAAGFESGYEKGVDDGRAAERYDPVRHRDYRDAERGYRDGYGSREAYRNNFRAGFRQGYEEGYRAGTRTRH